MDSTLLDAPLDVVTNDDIERFSFGDCHFLAHAISELTGWPIYAFVIGGGPDMHAFVLSPDGLAIDVKGARPLRSLKKEWKADHDVAPTTWSELYESWGGPSYGDDSSERAEELAPDLARAAGFDPFES